MRKNTNQKRIETLVADAVSQIAPHVESVVIIVTAAGTTEDGKGVTRILKNGFGNYFAQFGSAKIWVQRQQDEESVGTWNQFRPHNPPDDGESWKQA